MHMLLIPTTHWQNSTDMRPHIQLQHPCTLSGAATRFIKALMPKRAGAPFSFFIFFIYKSRDFSKDNSKSKTYVTGQRKLELKRKQTQIA